ncbi:MAG: GntR family transcriptional regulator [Planctomycetota bacterium]|jgi:DNA-binding LacI/PurR family transcriptional regulator
MSKYGAVLNTSKPNRKMLGKSIIDDIEEQIVSGKLAPGAALLSAKAIAQQYSVSAITANRAIAELASRKLVYRVQGSGTFVSDISKSQKGLSIGLGFEYFAKSVLQSINPVFDRSVKSAASKLLSAGIDLRYLLLESLTESSCSLLESLDGLLVLRRYVNDLTLPLLQKCKKPVVVFMHEKVDDIPFNQVTADMQSGVDDAVYHLCENGAKKIFLVSRKSSTHLARKEIFYKACLKFGIKKRDVVEITKECPYGDQGRLTGQIIAKEILQCGCRDAAVFSTGGFIAFGIWDIFSELTTKPAIPLVTIDDLEADGLLLSDKPVLSAVSIPRKGVSDRASELIAESIKSTNRELCSIRVPSVFTVRDSSIK